MFANNADDILARSTVETWVIKGEKGDVDVCKKCEGKVYEAEKLTTAAVWTLWFVYPEYHNIKIKYMYEKYVIHNTYFNTGKLVP